MNWKIYLVAFINIIAVCLPYNIIGCASDGVDPHDYFVSFFDKNLSTESTLKLFYYTNYQFLYDPEEIVDVSRLTSAEWVGYSSKAISTDDAYDFVCRINVQHLSAIYQHIEKKVPLAIPDSILNNGLAKYFIETGDREALGYLMFARKLEPHVTGSWSSWEPLERDSLAMSKLIRNGEQLFAVAKNDFIRLRYAYQLIRLAHYSKRYKDCINWYDQYIKPMTAKGVVPELSVSLKAGALLRLGKKNEAAYEFSKLFSRNKFNRISNYMSFDWSVKRFDANNRLACLQLCKNDGEKADLLGLFALGSNEDELKTLEQIFKLSPDSRLLELLIIREIHKLEENYFTPGLAFSSGKELSVIGYEEKSEKDSSYIIARQEITGFINNLCKRIAAERSPRNSNLYSLAAAHTAMISNDINGASLILKGIKQQELTSALKDQWNMTNILVTINAKDSMSPAFEDQLMTSVKWLESKARSNKEYQKFYRRLFADILAPKYQQMKGPDQVKYLLCQGVGDHISKSSEGAGWGYPSALSHLRNQVDAPRIEQLIQLMESKKQSAFNKFLVANSDFTRDDLNDIAGTTWLRKFNFTAAEKWFSKVPADYYQQEPFKTYLGANPFADLILDTHAPTAQDTVIYTKLSFTRKMIALEKQLTAGTGDQKASAYYELAKGCYHTSYWGNSWLMVAYDWSSYYDLSSNTENENEEYWYVNRAKDYYLKAYNGFTDRNMKAKALFMAAKCDQKQRVDLPNYFSYGDMKEYNAAISKWVSAFDKKNKYFSTLGKDYNNTAFYKEALRSCSFLKDFIIKGNQK